MKEKIEEIYEALKKLEIKATPGNVSILNGVFVFLKEIYAELGKGGNNDERTESDLE